jgi:5-methyltetrahydropteroyltriglutamate--homocysteine methyltransferase
MLLPTSLVGSYAQPEWLIDRARLAGRFPPRTRAKELWRIPEEHLEEAQNSATIEAIKLQEEAGIDIITDGEIRRESYSNRFATALDGVDIDNPGTALDRSGHPNPVPRVVGDIRRRHAVEVDDLLFLKRHTDRKVKITVPGPFTMSQQAQDDYYGDPRACALGLCAGGEGGDRGPLRRRRRCRAARRALHAGAPRGGRGLRARGVNAALDGAAGTTALHICFGYAAIIHARPTGYSFLPQLKGCSCNQVSLETAQSNLDTSVLEELRGKTIILGVLDLSDMAIETPEVVAARIRRALPHVDADKVIVAPDCGLKYLPRDVAFGKMKAMADGAAIVRAELG